MTQIKSLMNLFSQYGCFIWLLLVMSCTKPVQVNPINSMNWQPVESQNAYLPEGVRLYKGQNDALPLRAWYVYIDEPQPDIITRVMVSDDSTDNRETVSSFANDLGACVVVNGGYFTMQRTPANHVGLLVSDGLTWQPATPSVKRDTLRYQTARAAIGFTKNDELEITWATTRSDTHYTWPAPPAHRPGRPASPLDYRNARMWKVRDAMCAGPALVANGKIHVTSDQEVFFGTSIPKVHPRTAAGCTADGALILMVVDGRQEQSRGVDLEELATLMKDVGAVQAINLDGGGSSTLVVNGELINRPAGTIIEREVMSVLATFCSKNE